VAVALFMLYLGQNYAWCLRVAANRVLESTNYTHENTGAGHNFQSTNTKCESIPKPPYLSGILTYEYDQTAIFHINLAQNCLPVSKIFLLSFSPPTVMMTSWQRHLNKLHVKVEDGI
jgi:hypothetical protein